MKKEIENLVIWLIPAIILERVLAFASSMMFAELVGGGKGDFSTSLTNYSIGEIFSLAGAVNATALILPNVIIAIWIWRIEKKQSGRYVLWALGVFVMKYWILVLYIGQRLYGNNNAKKT